MNIKELLYEFWKWTGISIENYSKNNMLLCGDFEEFDFPLWDSLIHESIKLIRKKYIDNDELYDLLTSLALDNEAENILDNAIIFLPKQNENRFIEMGINHKLSGARWQIAEFIYRRKIWEGNIHYLEKLSEDGDLYVKRRALNCIEYISGGIQPFGY